MHAEDRIIHFATEMFHAPRGANTPALQKLYYELSQTRSAQYAASDVSNPLQARFHTRKGQHTHSLALFLPDRILVLEEWADIPLSAFQERLETVASKAAEELGIAEFTAQTVTLRSTFALSHFSDARAFLIDRVCQQNGRVAPYFQRPVSVGGIRFVLPETPEHPGQLNVLIESFRHSKNEVFVEVKGVFQGLRASPLDLSPFKENTFVVRNFISSNVYTYLNQFDQSPA